MTRAQPVRMHLCLDDIFVDSAFTWHRGDADSGTHRAFQRPQCRELLRLAAKREEPFGGRLVMLHIKRILVPIDFSPASELALEDAADLARGLGAEIDLLHVWELPALVGPQEVYIGAAMPAATINAIEAQSEKAVEQVAIEARAKNMPVLKARALPGSPYHIIVDEAERGRYDLIVVGTHSRKNIARLLLGSVAEQVVRHAPCPVLVARGQKVPAVRAPAA